MNPALTIAGKVLRNKWFWITVFVLILLLVLWRNWPKLSRLLKQDQGRDEQQAGLNDARKAQLETLARRIHTDVNSSALARRDLEAYEMAKVLNDGELRYLATFYENTLSNGTPMGTDIDGEWMAETSLDEDLIARLKTLALLA